MYICFVFFIMLLLVSVYINNMMKIKEDFKKKKFRKVKNKVKKASNTYYRSHPSSIVANKMKKILKKRVSNSKQKFNFINRRIDNFTERLSVLNSPFYYDGGSIDEKYNDKIKEYSTKFNDTESMLNELNESNQNEYLISLENENQDIVTNNDALKNALQTKHNFRIRVN